MKILRVTDDSTPAEITEAIGHLRQRQRIVEGVDAEAIGLAIDDLLDQLPRAAS